jgi:hypothetical protein
VFGKRRELTEDERRLAERSGRLAASIRLSVLPTAKSYVLMDPGHRPLDDESRTSASELLEQVSLKWREAEDLLVTALGDDVLPRDVIELLAAIEDSLVLAMSDDEAGRASILTVDQVMERVGALEASGVWGDLGEDS